MTTPRPEAKFAQRRGSTTLHIVTGVVNWYSGMTVTTECGVKRALVLEERADRNRLPATVCQRCVRILGWNYPLREK